MLDYAECRRIVQIKVAASFTVYQLEQLEISKDCWTATEHVVNMSLQLEWMMEHLRSAIIMCDRLLNALPAYDADPDERRHRAIELEIRCKEAYYHAEEIGNIIEQMQRLGAEEDLRLLEAEVTARSGRGRVLDMRQWPREISLPEVQTDEEEYDTQGDD